MNWVRNAWYVAAWADELEPGAVIARKILGTPVALFRGDDGVAAALRDRCPHRFAPLSAGKVVGSNIACGYHGLSFNSTGHCVANPHGPVPSRATVDSFPLVERYRALWIWMGDKTAADEQDIPDLGFLIDNVAPTALSTGKLLSGRANYLLYVDNLMDLSHVDFLHPDTLGGGAVTNSQPTVTEDEDRIDMVWAMPKDLIAPMLEQISGGAFQGKGQPYQRLTWYAPTIIRIDSGAVPEGGDDSTAFDTKGAHFLTPEDENSTHYFFTVHRNFQVENQALTDMITAASVALFENEDRPMIEKVARVMGPDDFWSLKPIILSVDQAAVRVRRKIEARAAEEQRLQNREHAAAGDNPKTRSASPSSLTPA